jgi:hypothetical protein
MLIAITKSGWLIGNKYRSRHFAYRTHTHTHAHIYTIYTIYKPNRVVLLSRDMYTNLANLFKVYHVVLVIRLTHVCILGQ